MPTKDVYCKRGEADEKVVTFETDDDRNVIKVRDGDRTVKLTKGRGGVGKLAQGDSIFVDLSGMNIQNVAEGTTIVTSSNPRYYWIYSGGVWSVYIC